MASGTAGTDLVPFQSFAIATLGSDVVELMRDNVGAGGQTVFDLDRVRIPAGGGSAWEVPTLDGVEAQKAVEGVIVHWREPRAFWRQSFDESGGGTPPDCSSDDGFVGVGDPGGACARCPMAQYGSDLRGGKGQACKQMRLLFMLRQDDLLPMAVFLPPTSIKPLRQYFLRLTSKGRAYYSVVTRLGLEQANSATGIKYSVAKPEVGGMLDATAIEQVRAYSHAMRATFDSVAATDEDLYSAGADGE